jgi:hypothetical protein
MASKGLNSAVVDVSASGAALVLPSGAVRVLTTFTVGGTPIVQDYPAPRGGRIVSLCASGPACVTEDGTAWLVPPTESEWRRMGNVLDDEALQ